MTAQNAISDIVLYITVILGILLYGKVLLAQSDARSVRQFRPIAIVAVSGLFVIGLCHQAGVWEGWSALMAAIACGIALLGNVWRARRDIRPADGRSTDQ